MNILRYFLRAILCGFAVFMMCAAGARAQIIDVEDFGSGTYPGAPLAAGQTTYNYNAPAQPADFPNILEDGDYVLATDSQQGFTNWASVPDNTSGNGTGYMMLVNADDNQSGEFYRRQVLLTANTTFDFLAYLVTVNSQADFDFCTANEGGLVLPNVTMQIESPAGAVLASFDTGDIPFNPNPEWEEFKLTFATPASTNAVEVVLINNSIGGCGNDLAIDDIIFRIAVTMEAADDSALVTNTDVQANSVLVLGANDTLDGAPLPGTEIYSVAAGSALPNALRLNTNTGEVGVAAGTPSGTYSFEYQVCETVSQFNCDTATATVTVELPAPAGGFCPVGQSTFSGDFYVVAAGVDPSTGGQPNNLNGAVGQPLPEGTTVTNDNDSGSTFFQSLVYDLTGDPDISVPEGEVIDVSFANFFNSNPTATVSTSSDGTTYTLLGTSAGPWTNNTFRYDEYTVPGGGARFMQVIYGGAGGLRFDGVVYGSQCQPGAAGVPIEAVADSGSVADSSTGDTVVLNVVDNDTIDGVSPPTDFVLAVSSGSSLPSVLSFDTSTGAVTVLQNAPTGIYSFDYDICEPGNTGNCQTATVTIRVRNPGGAAFCPAGTAAVSGAYYVVRAGVDPSTGGNPNNLNGAVGEPLPEGTTVTNDNESGSTFFQSLIYDLTGDVDISVPAGAVIDVSLANFFGSLPTAEISTSSDGTSYTSLGTSSSPWTNNTFRYDDYTVPSEGARFLKVTYAGAGGLRFDGVVYDTQCQPAAVAPVTLSANKTVAVYDPDELGLYDLPGNDVIYTIAVENTGTGDVDSDSLFLVDNMPGEITFYNDDIDDDGPETNPVSFLDSGTGLTFSYATTVGFSDDTTAPTGFSECDYAPTLGYDPAVNFICIKPDGTMSGGSNWSVSFRARIK